MSIIRTQKNNLDLLCKDNIGCYNKGCNLKHPRIFAGVCIYHLFGMCNSHEQCGLQHFTIPELKKELKTTMINGIYLFNICKNINCQDPYCRYITPQWKQLLCWKCLDNDDCEKHPQEIHDIQWLQKTVYEQYDIQECNPENLCPCVDKKCLKKSHQLPLNEYCIDYFKGVCPLILCSKSHVKWEDLKKQSMQQNYKQQIIKPCIKIDKNQNIIKQQQQYSLNIFQPKRLQDELTCAIIDDKIIDIIFILDCTSSMQKWIDIAKNSISTIMQEFKLKIPFKSIVRIAAVCYRDFDCAENIVYHNFTTHTDIIEKFIGQQVAKGGEDIPEDLIGALNQAYSLNISVNEQSMLNLFIMTDAPCHGKRYHDLMWDEYSEVYDGKLEEILEKFINLKQRLFVTFFYLLNQNTNSNKTTEKMEKIMKSKLQEQFFTASIGEKQFLDYVKFSLQTSLQQRARQETKDVITCTAICEKQRRMKFTYDKTVRTQSFLESFEQQINQQKIKQETVLKVETIEYKISKQEQGKFSKIYKAFDTKKNTYIVLKIPKNIASGVYTKKDIEIAEQEAEIRYREQLIAQQLMTLFNEKIFENQNLKQEIDPHFYSQPGLYRFKEPLFGLSVIYGETFINNENIKWTKVSNNLDWAKKEAKILAFSHFTFDVTNHELVITDLQGKVNLLSDPAVHTLKPNKFLECKSNFEEQGILEFFKNQHPNCNNVCDILNLEKHEDLQQNNDQPENFQISEALIQAMVKEKYNEKEKFIYLICQNCGKQDNLTNMNDIEHLCFQCSNQANENNKTIEECQCCKKQYHQYYRFKQLEATVQLICPDCEAKKCGKSNPLCYYCNEQVCLVYNYNFQFGEKEVKLCIEAVNYLKSLRCSKCNKSYGFQKLLSHEDFSTGKFECC